MRKRLLNLTIIILLMGGSAAYGFFVHRDHIFPYRQLASIVGREGEEPQQAEQMAPATEPAAEPKSGEDEETFTASESAMFEEIAPLYSQTDVESLISIHTPEEALSLRTQLVALLWGQDGLPQRQPDEVQQDVDDTHVEGVARVERLLVKMDFGLEAVAYHYIPAEANGKLVIWHEGHYDFVHYEYVQQFIEQGYAVLTYCMPQFCENTHPLVSVPRLGEIKLDFHEYMVFLQPETGHPLKYFIEPVVVGLNYVQQTYDYEHIAMVGYSGGGWSTTVAAAIDPRIQSSFPVAGSYPIFLREYRDRSHYEQQLPEVYTLVNFLEMYVLGGYGEGRMQLQINNQYDPCCYAGIKGRVYEDQVSQRVAQLGEGSWALYIDPYEEHGISPRSMMVIFDYLAEQ